MAFHAVLPKHLRLSACRRTRTSSFKDSPEHRELKVQLGDRPDPSSPPATSSRINSITKSIASKSRSISMEVPVFGSLRNRSAHSSALAVSNPSATQGASRRVAQGGHVVDVRRAEDEAQQTHAPHAQRGCDGAEGASGPAEEGTSTRR